MLPLLMFALTADAAEVGVGVGIGVPWQGSNLPVVGSVLYTQHTGLAGLSVAVDLSAYQLITNESVVINDPIGGPATVDIGYQTAILPLSVGPQYAWHVSSKIKMLAMGGVVAGTAKRTGGNQILTRGYGYGFMGRVGASVPYDKIRLQGSLDLTRLRVPVGGKDLSGNEINEQLGAVRGVLTVVMPLGGGDID